MSTRSGDIIVIVPEDEVELARASTDAEGVSYTARTLKAIRSTMEGFAEPLLRVMDRLNLTRGHLRLLRRENMEPVSYVVGAQYRGSFQRLIENHLPELEIVPIDDFIEQMKDVKASGELERPAGRHDLQPGACGVLRYGGMRHCDVVAVTATGVEVLTDFSSCGLSC